MKKIIYIVLISLSFWSCEDVIELDLESAEPRLVIDASLNWYKNTNSNFQFIKLSLSAPFFEDNVPPANGAQVFVTDSFNNRFDFIEDEETGIYRNDTFIPSIGRTYNLNILYNNETYTATEQLIPVSPIESVEQNNGGGFSGEETEFKAFYTDPEGVENYYLFEFISIKTNLQSLEVYDDEFIDGNRIFAFHSDEDLVTGDELIIRSFGVSERFYEFMNILLQQTDDENGDPFETQPALVRGNCINETNPDNYPFGYFKASEVSVFTYIVE
tara:strand:- start:45 stop:860 length:816 start_codon:yes stop_codon:yes gene_type:complete